MTDKEAIECLKGQIKCRECKDGIDCEKCSPNWSIKNDIEALKKGIKALENQKIGHWIEMGQNKDKTHNVICSECKSGFKFRGHANSIYTQNKYRFCSHCGARMEGDKQ